MHGKLQSLVFSSDFRKLLCVFKNVLRHPGKIFFISSSASLLFYFSISCFQSYTVSLTVILQPRCSWKGSISSAAAGIEWYKNACLWFHVHYSVSNFLVLSHRSSFCKDKDQLLSGRCSVSRSFLNRVRSSFLLCRDE